jgi:hypothetical protein
MSEHPLLAELAQFTGGFIATNNPSAEQLQAFHTNVASALLQQQPGEMLQQNFQFETLQNISTQNLNEEDLQYLNTVLQNASENVQAENNLRVFRREVPFASSQVKGSVPDWARGAKIEQTIGPLVNNLGQKSWWDLYKIVPAVQLYLQGAPQPALVLTLRVSTVFVLFHNYKDYTIPASSIWINSHLISSAAPDNQYCGLTINSGTLHFTNDVTLNNGKMIVPPGTIVTITLNLKQQTDATVSPDETGIDAKHAVVNLPQILSFTFSSGGSQIVAAGDASWTVYQNQDAFTFDANKPGFYLPQFNRVCIPFKSSLPQFDATNCLSQVCNVAGIANILQSAWALNCAVLDVNNPLVANGIGGMMIQTNRGLSASWFGLQDINLVNKEWINLLNPWILSEPGRISITDDKAGNINARQEYKLWKNKERQWNKIDLQYTASFLFFYNCLQSGTETVSAPANCTGIIDRPVDVAGKPFAFNSKQTIYLLSWSQQLRLVILYDDNLILDNSGNNPLGRIVTFKSQAISLNNALLTISPIKGFLLAGELKNAQEFTKAAIIDTFGLLGYVPMLPDPYAADLDVFSGVYRMYAAYNKQGGIPINAIRQLLIGILTWTDDNIPDVRFLWGDIVQNTNNNYAEGQISQDVLATNVSLNLLSNQNLAALHTQQSSVRQTAMLEAQYVAAGFRIIRQQASAHFHICVEMIS